MTADTEAPPWRTESTREDGTRITRYAERPAEHPAISHPVTGLILSLEWQGAHDAPEATILVEVAIPVSRASDPAFRFGPVTLVPAETSPAVTVEAEPDERASYPATIQVMCDVDHDDIAPGMIGVRDALRAEHDALHTGPQRYCDNQVCRAANNGGIL
jgi:hypothetical protein